MKYKIKVLITILLLTSFVSACNEKNTPNYNSIAFLEDKVIYTIDSKNQLSAKNEEGRLIDYSELGKIKSIESFGNTVYLLDTNGKVIVLSKEEEQPKFLEWENIEMVTASAYGVFGLKENGDVVYSSAPYELKNEEKIRENVESWSNIDYIDASSITVAGVTDNGEILYFGIFSSEFSDVTKEWNDIREISIWKDTILGVDSFGEVFIGSTSVLTKFHEEIVNIFTNSKEICVGDSVIIGCMPDGLLKIAYSTAYEDLGSSIKIGDTEIKFGSNNKSKEDFEQVEQITDAIDIFNIGDCFVILRKSGEILILGEYSSN